MRNFLDCCSASSLSLSNLCFFMLKQILFSLCSFVPPHKRSLVGEVRLGGGGGEGNKTFSKPKINRVKITPGRQVMISSHHLVAFPFLKNYYKRTVNIQHYISFSYKIYRFAFTLLHKVNREYFS